MASTKRFIEIEQPDGTKITLAKRYIIKVETATNGKTRLTIDVPIETNENNYYFTDEPYADVVDRLDAD